MRKERGSELFETEIMNTEEATVYCLAAKDNGHEMETILSDLHLVDDMLHAKRLHFATLANNRYTRAGNVKKNSQILDVYSDMLDGYIKQQKS